MFLSGLGGGFGIFRPLVERFSSRCRVIGFDYRGLYESDAPRAGGTLAMEQHARDLLALLRHARVDEPILVGWSMGVQLALELHRTHPTLARGLVAIHGAAGRPLDTAFDSRWTARVAPAVLSVLGHLERRAAGVGPRLVNTPGVARGFTWLCRGLGMMSGGVDVEAFRAVAETWTQLDFAVYAETFARLGEHDASDLLPKITTPTLLIAGGRDPFTPARLAESMVAAMPDAQLALVPEATHFGLLEAPDAIADHVTRFLHTRLGVEVEPARRRGPVRGSGSRRANEVGRSGRSPRRRRSAPRPRAATS